MLPAVMHPSDNRNRSQSAEPTCQTDVDAAEIFEHQRSEILQITNYLEALRARLLSASAGATSLSVIADVASSNPIQTV